MTIKTFTDNSGNVTKYVFTMDDAIAESVLYKYESYLKRTVICCSVQSGCPVGCLFCGTGKRFIRNLSSNEIVQQVEKIISDIEKHDDVKCSLNLHCDKFQIMFMSMGEPMLNFSEVQHAILKLNNMYPKVQLLLSTIGVNNPQSLMKS